jgi:uncharacterized protein YbjT (DUF2867 family)
VAPAFFMENLLGPALLAGVRAGRLSMPLPAACRLQMAAVDDIAGLVRLAIERPAEFVGKRIEIASDELTGPEMATALSHASGMQVAFAQGSLARVRAQNEDLARGGSGSTAGFDIDIETPRREHPDVGWPAWRAGLTPRLAPRGEIGPSKRRREAAEGPARADRQEMSG